jgi:hypothetical protein
MKYFISSNSTNPKKSYEVIEAERLFLDSLLQKTTSLKGEFSLSRMSNGTINVSYNTYPVGKIKLQSRKHQMMYMKNLYDSVSINGELQDFIEGIDFWIKYINKYL